MSKYNVKQPVVDKMSELLFELFGKENNKEGCSKMLQELFSPFERLMVGKRLLIMYMIFIGIDYDVIINVVKVSRATIAKYAILFDRSVYIRKSILHISSKDKLHTVFDQMVSSLFEPGFSNGSWRAARRLKQRVQKQQGFS